MEKDKYKKYEIKYDCTIKEYGDTFFMLEKDGYDYICQKYNISKFRFSVASMTIESRLNYINETYFKNTNLLAVDTNKGKVLVKNTVTEESVWQPIYNINKHQILSLTTKSAKYTNKVKELLGDNYDLSNIKVCSTKDIITLNCPEHGEFKLSVANIMWNGQTMCPKCSYSEKHFGKNGFIKNCSKQERRPLLYVITFNSEEEKFIKIGITSQDIKDRIKRIPYTVSKIKLFTGDASEIYDTEKFLHKKYSSSSYLPLQKFNGRLECYKEDNLENLETKILENCKKLLKVL
jgi:hypothetical protein